MAMSIGQQALASLTGNIETAYLVIHDYRKCEPKSSKDKNGEDKNIKSDKMLEILAKKRIEATKQALENKQDVSYPGSINRTFKVQFNPSELRLNASALAQNKSDATKNQSRTIATVDASLMLTVRLYFDAMNTYDAFMWDKFTLGASVQTIHNIAGIATEVSGDKEVKSVRKQVEALVAAVRNPYTRTISFRWADFSFIGMLSTVQANYTMFSTSGHPVRAEVILRIKHEMNAYMIDPWLDSFDKAFGKDTKNLVTPGQTTANLLNLVL